MSIRDYHELMSGKEFASLPKAKPYSPIETIDGLINMEDFTVGVLNPDNAPEVCIFYKMTPLWRTIYPIKAIDIIVPEPVIEYDGYGNEEYREPYMLFCIDAFQDIYTYGNWNTLEELKAWLENPTPLY